jgi:peptidoglycan/LPS O-acetylase OafA/YrhL
VTASAVLDGGPVSRTERGFPCLDGARAIAATAVVLTHAAFWTGNYTPDLLGRALNRAEVGVAIFFVLSGFLLSRPFFQAAVRGRPAPDAAAYLWRRALRILPAYWLLIVAAFLFLPGNRNAGAGDWLRHLALLQVYGGRFGDGLSHTWSLATEVAFYLVLPVLAAGLVRLAGRDPWRPGRVLAALAALAAAGVAWVLFVTDLLGWASTLWLPAYAGWFAAGMAIAVISVSDRDWPLARAAHQLGADLWTCWVAAGALFVIAATPLTGPPGLATLPPGQAALRHVLYLAVGTLVVWPLVFGDQSAGRTRRLLAARPVTFLGEISYGLFLFHVLVLAGGYAVLGLPDFSGNLVVVFVGTWLGGALLGVLTYVVVERPLSRWRHVVPDRSRGGRSQATTTAASATTANI